MRLSKTMLHPYSMNRFYIPCTFELRTYDAMGTQPRFNTLRKMTLIQGGPAQQNDINDVHMAHGGRLRNDTRQIGSIGFNVSVAHMAHPHPCLQEGKNWNRKTCAPNMRNVPPWIKCDTMASMNTKCGMATHMTCQQS